MTRRLPGSTPESPQPRALEQPMACRACPLRTLSAFRRCSARELSFVAGMKRRQIVVAAGSRLQQSPKDGNLYTLYEGWATRSHSLRNGSKQILDFVLPGDVIGWSTALLGRSDYIVEAMTPITLCELDAKRLPALIEDHPALALGMLKARVLDQERADRRLSTVGRMGAAERIAYLMLDLRDRLIHRGLQDERELPFPLHRSQIADAVGLSKVHVMRALKQMREQKLAVIEERRLIIPNAGKLARFCDHTPLHVPPDCHLLL